MGTPEATPFPLSTLDTDFPLSLPRPRSPRPRPVLRRPGRSVKLKPSPLTTTLASLLPLMDTAMDFTPDTLDTTVLDMPDFTVLDMDTTVLDMLDTTVLDTPDSTVLDMDTMVLDTPDTLMDML